jgi:hypothetical protein
MHDARCTMHDAGYRQQDVGCSMQADAGCRMQDTGYRMQAAVETGIRMFVSGEWGSEGVREIATEVTEANQRRERHGMGGSEDGGESGGTGAAVAAVRAVEETDERSVKEADKMLRAATSEEGRMEAACCGGDMGGAMDTGVCRGDGRYDGWRDGDGRV